jgi:hypothetical protein
MLTMALYGSYVATGLEARRGNGKPRHRYAQLGQPKGCLGSAFLGWGRRYVQKGGVMGILLCACVARVAKKRQAGNRVGMISGRWWVWA